MMQLVGWCALMLNIVEDSSIVLYWIDLIYCIILRFFLKKIIYNFVYKLSFYALDYIVSLYNSFKQI